MVGSIEGAVVSKSRSYVQSLSVTYEFRYVYVIILTYLTVR
jgi:hypothetical protein